MNTCTLTTIESNTGLFWIVMYWSILMYWQVSKSEQKICSQNYSSIVYVIPLPLEMDVAVPSILMISQSLYRLWPGVLSLAMAHTVYAMVISCAIQSCLVVWCEDSSVVMIWACLRVACIGVCCGRGKVRRACSLKCSGAHWFLCGPVCWLCMPSVCMPDWMGVGWCRYVIKIMAPRKWSMLIGTRDGGVWQFAKENNSRADDPFQIWKSNFDRRNVSEKPLSFMENNAVRVMRYTKKAAGLWINKIEKSETVADSMFPGTPRLCALSRATSGYVLNSSYPALGVPQEGHPHKRKC